MADCWGAVVIGRTLRQSGLRNVPALLPLPASGQRSRGDQAQHNRARLGYGLEGDRPEEAICRAIEPGDEVEDVRGTGAAVIAEGHAPQLALAEKNTGVERDLTLPLPARG